MTGGGGSGRLPHLRHEEDRFNLRQTKIEPDKTRAFGLNTQIGIKLSYTDPERSVLVLRCETQSLREDDQD